MELITKNLQNINLNTTSSVDVESKFNIFSFDNNDIEVIGTVDKPWFKAKDVLKILGYSNNKNTMKDFIKNNIPNKYKNNRGIIHPSSPRHYNKDKEIFINKDGITHLLCKTTTKPIENINRFLELPEIKFFNFNIEQNKIYFRKEQEYMNNIKDCFFFLKFEEQYNVLVFTRIQIGNRM